MYNILWPDVFNAFIHNLSHKIDSIMILMGNFIVLVFISLCHYFFLTHVLLNILGSMGRRWWLFL